MKSFLKKTYPLIIGGVLVAVLIVIGITRQAQVQKSSPDKLSAETSVNELAATSKEQEQTGGITERPPVQNIATEMPTSYNVAPAAEPVIEDSGTGMVFKNYSQGYVFNIPDGYTLSETPRVTYLEKDANTRIAVVYGIGPYLDVDTAGENLSSETMLSTISAVKDNDTYIFNYYASGNYQYPNEMDVQEYIMRQYAGTPDPVEGKTYEELVQETIEQKRKAIEEEKRNNPSVTPSDSVEAPSTSVLDEPTPTQTSVTQANNTDLHGNLRIEDFELELYCGKDKSILFTGQARVLKTSRNTGVLIIPLSETVDQSEQVKIVSDSFKMEDFELPQMTYKTFDGGDFSFEYPEGWSLSQQGDLSTIKAPSGSASPYNGTVITVHIDNNNKVATPYHYLNILESDIVASTFITPVDKSDYTYENRMNTSKETDVDGVKGYYFEVTDVIKPYSENVVAYIGPLGHILSSKRYCLNINNKNCMVNITTNSKGKEVWEHILGTLTVHNNTASA